MTTFNILGCCVCRDIFRICETEEYKVLKFIQSINPVSFCEQPQNQQRLNQEDLGFVNWSNFGKRNLCIDANKNVFAIIENNPSDYMIFDLCEMRFLNCRINLKNGDSFYMTQTKRFGEAIDKEEFAQLLDLKSIEKDIILEDVELKKVFDTFIAFLFRHYSPSKIIMIENLPNWKHLDEIGKCFCVMNNSYIAGSRGRLKKYYRYFENHMPGINIIKMPEHCLGYIQHRWGKDSLHFIDEYYKYLFQSVDIIVKRRNDSPYIDLERLRSDFSKYFSLLDENKRMQYYLESSVSVNNLLIDPKFQDGGGWKILSSKNSKYEKDKKTLICGGNESDYVIILQAIPADKVRGEITFSLFFETSDATMLKVAFRYSVKENEKITKKILYNVSINSMETIQFYSQTVDLEIPEDINEVEFLMYLNHPGAMASIYNVKLEKGTKSTLFYLEQESV